jgi:hypothetical protein
LSIDRHGQLAAELPAQDGCHRLALSASKELEPGFRAAILLADGLFRLDVALAGDTLRTIVRNFSAGELTMDRSAPGYASVSILLGPAEAYEPTRSDLGFALGSANDRVDVRVTIATLRFAERGTVRVTAQAILQQAPERNPSTARAM